MKYCHRILICWLALLVPFAKAGAQSGSDLFRVVKSSNGQSFLLSNANAGDKVYTDIYFRMGTIYEFDSLSGISILLSKVINKNIASDISASGKQIKYYCTVEPEQMGFHFESDAADLDYIFRLSDSRIVHPDFDESSLEEAKAEVATAIDSIRHGGAKIETDALKILWGNDYKKLNPYGDQQTYKRLKTQDLTAFHNRYFLPFNNAIIILGSFSEKMVLAKLQDIFKDFKSREFNPELITKVIDFKPIVNIIQLLSTRGDKNQATIYYQNPGARQDRNATYPAYILSEMINDKSGKIQRSLQDSGLANIKATYACNNFYGSFTLSAQPSGTKYISTFDDMAQLMSDISKKNYFSEDDLDRAKKNITIEYKNLKADNMKIYMSLVERYRFSSDENYFTSLPDSISDVTPDEVRQYIDDYFTNHSSVRGLVTSADSLAGAAPGQQYFALNDSVSDIRFTYDLNKTDIETEAAKRDFDRLVQWLKLNTDIHVQINGFSDEGEFIKSYDDSVLRFIDSTATFHKAMPDATKKGYLRIEFMRAMKIAKALYEAGITEDRISGTSMVFTSDTKEAAAENRKCTVSLEKIKPHPSLYEYHFGKKKEGTDGTD
jgi:predicted Zn-dependent peptidase